MRIAFLSRDAYDMLTGGHGENVGGAELQQTLVARELARRSHDVVFIETAADYKEETVVDGIRVVVKDHHPTRPLPVRLPLRLAATFRALRAVDPDAVYMRIPNVDMLAVVCYCALADARFVYGFAHDSEVTGDPVAFDRDSTGERILWALLQQALGAADVLVAQNDFQRTAAQDRYPDADVSLISNGYPDPSADSKADETDRDRPVVLWMATLREWKRPDLVLELASRIPEAEFVIVGGAASEAPDLHNSIKRKAEAMENVRFEGFVPYEDVDEYFDSADVFVNTSTEEGFPNTFLQSWAHSTPVVSLDVDPNETLRSNPIGHYAVGSIDKMVSQLREIVKDDERRGRYGRCAYEYFRENHSIDVVTTRYEEAFEG